jgi:hypothetical protein
MAADASNPAAGWQTQHFSGRGRGGPESQSDLWDCHQLRYNDSFGGERRGRRVCGAATENLE